METRIAIDLPCKVSWPPQSFSTEVLHGGMAMIQRMGIGLMLAVLLPAVSLAEQPGIAQGSDSINSEQGQLPPVQPGSQTSLKFYHPDWVTSALPHWWHSPQQLAVPVKRVVQQGTLGQRGVEYNRQPPIDLFLGPGFPIMQEEEPLLGID